MASVLLGANNSDTIRNGMIFRKKHNVILAPPFCPNCSPEYIFFSQPMSW